MSTSGSGRVLRTVAILAASTAGIARGASHMRHEVVTRDGHVVEESFRDVWHDRSSPAGAVLLTAKRQRARQTHPGKRWRK